MSSCRSATISAPSSREMLQEYPHQIGNAEGIRPPFATPPTGRCCANMPSGPRRCRRGSTPWQKIGDRELDFVREVNRLENALQRAEVASTQAGEGHPLLLALDPGAFGGDGRALVSFGADPYTAESVSWYRARPRVPNWTSSTTSCTAR